MANKGINIGGMIKKSLAFGDYIDIVAPSIYRGGLFNGQYFFGGNGLDYRFNYTNHRSALKAYESCPPLAAIINRKAQCYINGKTDILNTAGKPAQSPDAKRLRTLLKRPNPIQTWRQFEAQQYIYVQLFGFCVTLPIIPAGFEALGPTYASSLWNVPPYMLLITETTKLFYQTDLSGIVESIVMDYKGITTKLPLQNLFIFKDFVPSANSMVFPDSRVKSLGMPINNIIGAYLSRNELINYAGSQGIFSPGATLQGTSLPLKEEQKTQLQDDFKRQYGIQRGQWRYIIAPTKMDWTAVGKPTKDLMLFEEVVDSTMRICDSYNYPSPLLNSSQGPNKGNTANYQAQIYNDGIIPESCDLYEQWNAYFNTDKYNLTLIKTFDHVSVLKEDKVQEGQALLYLNQSLMLLWQQNLITANQVLEANELPTVQGWDIYYTDFITQNKIMGGQTVQILPDSKKPKNTDDETDEEDK